MEPNSFGVIRGEQPLIRASRASKVAGVLFWFSFGTQKRTSPAAMHFAKGMKPAPHEYSLCGKQAYFLAASAMLSCATSEGDTPGMRPA